MRVTSQTCRKANVNVFNYLYSAVKSARQNRGWKIVSLGSLHGLAKVLTRTGIPFEVPNAGEIVDFECNGIRNTKKFILFSLE